MNKRHILIISVCFSMLFCGREGQIFQSEIMKWQDGKEAAISLTYDDGSITQFRIAMPLMDERGFPATFFINTRRIPGSKYKRKFIGKPIKEIIEETEKKLTNKENFFERAGATRFLGYQGIDEYQNRAGRLFERGEFDEAYKLIDDLYRQVRKGEFKTAKRGSGSEIGRKYKPLTWDEIRQIADNGHEFAVHTISHPYLPALDEANILYEIEKCREEIEAKLGAKHTFSIECPYGMKDERVLQYVYPRFPLIRNKVTDDYVEEILRGSKKDPGTSNKEYIQWQRGPHTDTPMDLMKEWIDKSIEHNVWLVLVFHGVEDVGWEPKTKEEYEEYFDYIKSKEKKVWVATFQDAGKYIRERVNGSVLSTKVDNIISVELTHTLDPELYDLPLTLKTFVPPEWEFVQVKQGNDVQKRSVEKDERVSYILYRAVPNSEVIIISEEN